MRRYNEPKLKVTACSVDEDILTTSNYTDLNDSTDYDFDFASGTNNSPTVGL